MLCKIERIGFKIDIFEGLRAFIVLELDNQWLACPVFFDARCPI